MNSDKEHVTPFIKRNCETNQGSLYSSISIVNEIDYSAIRLTVDEMQDFDAINLLINKLGTNSNWIDYTNYILKNVTEFTNQNILRNEGYLRSIQKD